MASAIDVSVTLLAKSFDATDNVLPVTSMQRRTSFALLLSIDVPSIVTADSPFQTMTARQVLLGFPFSPAEMLGSQHLFHCHSKRNSNHVPFDMQRA